MIKTIDPQTNQFLLTNTLFCSTLFLCITYLQMTNIQFEPFQRSKTFLLDWLISGDRIYWLLDHSLANAWLRNKSRLMRCANRDSMRRLNKMLWIDIVWKCNRRICNYWYLIWLWVERLLLQRLVSFRSLKFRKKYLVSVNQVLVSSFVHSQSFGWT